jgi:hypothetical protein
MKNLIIILIAVVALSSCSTSRGINIHNKKGNSYSKKNPYRVSYKSKGRCVGGTCYAF